MAFEPKTAEIIVGDSVKWNNLDSMQHSAIRDDRPEFDTGLLDQDQESEPIVFDSESSDSGFEYRCGPHAFMKGWLIVRKSK